MTRRKEQICTENYRKTVLKNKIKVKDNLYIFDRSYKNHAAVTDSQTFPGGVWSMFRERYFALSCSYSTDVRQ